MSTRLLSFNNDFSILSVKNNAFVMLFILKMKIIFIYNINILIFSVTSTIVIV